MSATIKISNEVGAVFDECLIEDNTLFLPEGQLDRKLYTAVNKILTIMGGKWNRKAKGHIFDSDPTEVFDAAVQAGEVVEAKKFFQFFETPQPVIDRLIELAELKSTDLVLEPSAGKGAIAKVVKLSSKKVWCVELNEDMAQALDDTNQYHTVNTDFLTMTSTGKFDKVIMNPPFSKFRDIDHVEHAFKFLKSGGLLVSVMSEGTFFRTTKKARDFREWLDTVDAHIENVPEGAFKSSGTLVNTRIVMIEKR